MANKLIGYGPNQLPTNGMLGDMAYLDSAYFAVQQMRVNSATSVNTTNLPNNTSGVFKTGTGGKPELWFNDNGSLSKYAPLDFTPVQQGGGALQTTNKIYVGWANNGAGLRATVDNTDLGSFLHIDDTNFVRKGTALPHLIFGGGSNGTYSGGQVEIRSQNSTTEATVGWHIPSLWGVSWSLSTDRLMRMRNSNGVQVQALSTDNGNIWAPAFNGWLTDHVWSVANERGNAWGAQYYNSAIAYASTKATGGVFHHSISVGNCGNAASLTANSSGNTLVLNLNSVNVNCNCNCGNN